MHGKVNACDKKDHIWWDLHCIPKKVLPTEIKTQYFASGSKPMNNPADLVDNELC
jgi:hypothetical protein